MKVYIALLSVIALSGCITYRVPAYTPGLENRETIKGLEDKFSVTALEPEFEDTGSIFCRGAGLVSVADGETFTDYISNALKTELASVGKYEEVADKSLRLQLEKVDFSTSMGATNWFIDGVYSIDGRQERIATTYNDRSSYFGNVACNNMAQYFLSAVRSHIGELLSTPSFSYLRSHANSQSSSGSLAERLKDLMEALDAGLVTQAEYEQRRQQILDQH